MNLVGSTKQKKWLYYENQFIAISYHNTRWDAELEYTKFYGFMTKLMAFLMPGMFKKANTKMA